MEELLALPNDTAYHAAVARVQVSAAEDVRVAAVSGDRPAPNATSIDPVVVRLTDANNLPYPGVRLQAAASDGSAVAQAAVVTGEDGQASFRWTPGTAPVNELRIGIEGAAPALTVRVGARAVSALAVVNAASFAARVSPGALATIFGYNLAGGAQEQARTPWPRALAGVTVLVNGRPAPVVFVSDGQINFLVPADLVDGTADVAVTNAAGASAPLRVAVAPLAPGLFGALVSGTGQTTAQRAPRGAASTWRYTRRASGRCVPAKTASREPRWPCRRRSAAFRPCHLQRHDRVRRALPGERARAGRRGFRRAAARADRGRSARRAS